MKQTDQSCLFKSAAQISNEKHVQISCRKSVSVVNGLVYATSGNVFYNKCQSIADLLIFFHTV